MLTIAVGILLASAVIFLAWYIPTTNAVRNRQDAAVNAARKCQDAPSLQDQAQLFVQGSMRTALATYRIQMGAYPSTGESLGALAGAPSGKGSRPER